MAFTRAPTASAAAEASDRIAMAYLVMAYIVMALDRIVTAFRKC